MRRFALLLLGGALVGLGLAAPWPGPGAAARAAGPDVPPSVVGVADAVFSPDGRLLLTRRSGRLAPEDHKRFRPVELWDVRTGKRLRAFPEPGWGPLRFLPDGEHVVCGGYGQPLRLREARSGKVVRTFRGSPTEGLLADLSPDGKLALVIVREEDWALQLWDVGRGALARTLSRGEYRAARFTPDGQRVYAQAWPSTSMEGVGCRVWSVRSGRLLRQTAQAQRWRYPLAFSPSGRWALADQRADDKEEKDYLVLWEVETGREALAFQKRRGGQIRALSSGTADVVSYLPGGRQVVSLDGDGMLRLWEATSGKLIRSARLGGETPTRCALSPDGWLAFTAHGRDYGLGWEWMTFTLWDTESGKRVRTLQRSRAR